MRRIFCDNCGDEVKEPLNENKSMRFLLNYSVDGNRYNNEAVIYSIQNENNHCPDFCSKCVMEAIEKELGKAEAQHCMWTDGVGDEKEDGWWSTSCEGVWHVPPVTLDKNAPPKCCPICGGKIKYVLGG